MANVWVYDGDDKVRYVLGKPGKNNLLVIGVNPSTAKPGALDPTMRKVVKISDANGYDGFIMVNLYPQRATKPAGMKEDSDLIEKNIAQIKAICEKYDIKNAWCAWGNVIDIFGKDSFLHKSWGKIKTLLEDNNITAWHYDKLTNAGNPRHPLYVANGREFHKM